MAENTSYIEKSGVKAMPWSTFFTRTSNIPLDRSSIFGSYEDALKYAAGDEKNPDSRNLVTASYVGQIITVYENNEVDVYKINVNRELEPVGEGRGVIIVNSKDEANVIASKTKSIGNMIMSLDNQTMYFVKYDASQNKNILIEMFKVQNNEIIYDCGTF